MYVVAKKYGVVVIADEIYEDMVFDGNEYIPIARLSQESKELALPILTCSGLAKRFLVPGWRFGWVAVNEADGFDISGIKKGLFDLSTLIIGSCTLIQSALPDIFANTLESFYEDTNKVLEGNARFLSESLSTIEGLKVIKPQGTMYMLVGIDFERFGSEIDDDLKISELLISEQSISVLPGSVPHGLSFSFTNCYIFLFRYLV
jgi:tyrosine aminotransferase